MKSDSDIIDYLKNPEHWLFLTDDYEKAKNNPNFKYDPINVGTYNYSAFDLDYINLDGSKKKTSSSKHNTYDVYPYLGGKSKYSNWGNVPGMIYRNTKSYRDSNLTKYNNSAAVTVYEEWREKFDKE